jgi:hypothetical protein
VLTETPQNRRGRFETRLKSITATRIQTPDRPGRSLYTVYAVTVRKILTINYANPKLTLEVCKAAGCLGVGGIICRKESDIMSPT